MLSQVFRLRSPIVSMKCASGALFDDEIEEVAMNTDPIKLEAMRAGRATIGQRFNPDMFATAREAAGLSQKDLGLAIGVSQPLVGQWEARLSLPSEEQLDRAAKELHVRKEFFFVDRPRRLASMSDFYHRAFARAKRLDVKATHARCSIIDL